MPVPGLRVALLACFLSMNASSAAYAQEAGQDRLAKEASAQAAQADKLLKAGQFVAALKLYRAERDSRKTLGDARYEAYALRAIGCCLVGLGEDEEAIASFREARTIDANRDDKGFEGYDGLLIAQAERRLDRPADAVATLGQALPKLGQAVDRDHERDARLELAGALIDLGEPDKARPESARAVTLAEELDDARRLADAWWVDGVVERDLGRLGPALERLLDARDAFREQGREVELARTTRVLADLSVRLGHPERAARRFEEAATFHAKLGDAMGEAEDRLDLASVRLDLGDSAAAIREAIRARDGFLGEGDDKAAIEAQVVLAQAQSRAKDGLADAAATVRDALERSARVHRDAPAERLRLLLLSAELEHRLGRKADVTARLDAAKSLAAGSRDEGLQRAVAAAVTRLSPER
jgi:tetratricopeptide (TPR) repeat protein